MSELYTAILGFGLGFMLCVIMMSNYHKRLVDRVYMIIEDKLYIIKEDIR